MSATTMLEKTRKGLLPFDFKGDMAPADVITERLYTCPNGWQLGARRGGRLHLADATTWEIFVLNSWGIAVGESVGWVDEPTLERAVERLAAWPEGRAA